MSTGICAENSSSKENEDANVQMNEARTNSIFVEIMSDESRTAAERIKVLQSTIDNLKFEIQGVMNKMERNIDDFRGKMTDKFESVMNQLSDKQMHIQCTLDNCYKIIANLVESFLEIGYGLEKDIADVSLKVNDLDAEMLKMVKKSTNDQRNDEQQVRWFISDEGRISKSKCFVVGPVLPQFKSGDADMRRQFILRIVDVFKKFKVPKTMWVELASSRLVGAARDWWSADSIGKPSMKWEEFMDFFAAGDCQGSMELDATNGQNQGDHNNCGAVPSSSASLFNIPFQHNNYSMFFGGDDSSASSFEER